MNTPTQYSAKYTKLLRIFLFQANAHPDGPWLTIGGVLAQKGIPDTAQNRMNVTAHLDFLVREGVIKVEEQQVDYFPGTSRRYRHA